MAHLKKELTQFVEYARRNPSETKQLLKNYATCLKQRTEKPRTNPEYLNPNTVPNKFKEIKKLLEYSDGIDTDFIILASSSGGLRVGAWNDVSDGGMYFQSIKWGGLQNSQACQPLKLVCSRKNP